MTVVDQTAPTMTSVSFPATAAAGGQFQATVTFSEVVNVLVAALGEEPTLTATPDGSNSGTNGATNVIMKYLSGTGSNALFFQADAAYSAGEFAVGDQLNIADTGSVALVGSSTIKDGASNDADLATAIAGGAVIMTIVKEQV